MRKTTLSTSIGRTALATLALAVPATIGACGDDAPAPTVQEVGPTEPQEVLDPLPVAVQSIDVVGTEYHFEISGADTLSPGWTRVSFENRGGEAHQIMFARLKDGVDLTELSAVAGDDSSGAAAIEFVDMIGGVSYIGPGQSIEALVELPEGMVMAMCYVPDPDGVAHALSGMTSVLNVDGDTTTAPATGPELVQGTIVMGEDGYEIPSGLTTGWYHVVNENQGTAPGEGLHELSILGLEAPLQDDGLDSLLADLATNATPEVPVIALGGMGALSAGFDGYLYLDLGPGDYLAVDFMPDPGDARPHLLDGFATTFAVGDPTSG